MNRFRSSLQTKRLVKTVELLTDPSSSVESLLALATGLEPVVDGVIVGESSSETPGISPLALAPLLLKHGIDPIPRLSCRDRNRIALQSELLGLRANGITSLLLEEGEPLAGLKPVYDTHLPDLVKLAAEISEEGADDEFNIGTPATVSGAGLIPDTESLNALGLAGARFLVIEPPRENKKSGRMNQLRELMETLVTEKITWSYSVVVSFSLPDDPDAEETGALATHIREVSGLPGVSGINFRLGRNAKTALRLLEGL